MKVQFGQNSLKPLNLSPDKKALQFIQGSL